MVDPYRAELADIRASFGDVPTKLSVRKIVGSLPQSELTHSIYPYPARLVRHIPRLLLPSLVEEVGSEGTVLDPFCGSGTVLLEANRIGAAAYGIDSNPVATLVSRVKTTPVNLDHATKALSDLFASSRASQRLGSAPPFLRRWYDPRTLLKLDGLFTAWRQMEPGSISDLAAVVLARHARATSLMDARVPVPVHRKDSCEYFSSSRFWSDLERSAAFVLGRVATLGDVRGSSVVLTDDSRSLTPYADLKGKRVTMVTSPPYGAAQKYARSTSIEAVWLGYSAQSGPAEIARNAIGRERLSSVERASIPSESEHGNSEEIKHLLKRIAERSPDRAAIYAHYFADMRRALEAPISAGVEVVNICLIAGSNTVAGRIINTHLHLAKMIQSFGYSLRFALEDEIRGRAFLTTRRGSSSPLRAEHIYVFGRESDG